MKNVVFFHPLLFTLVVFTVVRTAASFVTSSTLVPKGAFVSSQHSIHFKKPVDRQSKMTRLPAATVDPTTALTNVLGGVIDTPIVLAIPILAAVTLAGAFAWFIVSYSNPSDEDN